MGRSVGCVSAIALGDYKIPGIASLISDMKKLEALFSKMLRLKRREIRSLP